MSVETSTITTQKHYPPQVSDDAEIFYPDTDESIMPEGILHFLLSVRLASTLLAFFANREDVKVFGNCMLYYEQGFPQKFISPDLMICFGLEKSPTSVYKLWETKVVPTVVIEFASETTWLNDVSSKLAIYQKLGVKEYYVYEVDTAHFPASLIAYRLDNGVLTEVEILDKRILSKSLGLEFVDTGETLRLFDPETNEFLMTTEEIQAENEKLKAEIARLKAEKQMTETNGNKLISLQNLQVHFKIGGGLFKETKFVKAVDGVSLDIKRGETLGLVGESGCGKSTLGKAILRLTEPTGGQVFYQGKDLANLSQNQMREERKNLQMIFQDPYASLNPRMTVGQIIGEPIRTFNLAGGRNVEETVKDLMETVGMSRRFIKRYPHEFSGGQRQRIGIARALAVAPEFIVADEPISALDVSIQAQIMNLMEKLQAEKKLTYLFISHDLRAVRHLSDRVAVMYLGKIVELADGIEVYGDPLMPYTKALISAVPVPDPKIEAKRQRIILTGDVPSPINPPSGCNFHTRCPFAIEECRKTEPRLVEIKPKHYAACIRISPEKPYIEENIKKGN